VRNTELQRDFNQNPKTKAMKASIEPQSSLRNDRNVWRTVAGIVSACALVTNATAASITENAAAPTGNILTSQLADLGPGVPDLNRDYTPDFPGQTFTVSGAATLDIVTVMGNGDSAGSWQAFNQPFNGTEIWTIQFGSVNTGTGAITPLDEETATGFAAPANIADFLSFSLANPVVVTPGVTYEFDITMAGLNGQAWFGLAHSTGDAYAGGTAINVTGGHIVPNPNNYDYVFAVQGVPEPGVLAWIGLGGFGLIATCRRRGA